MSTFSPKPNNIHPQAARASSPENRESDALPRTPADSAGMPAAPARPKVESASPPLRRARPPVPAGAPQDEPPGTLIGELDAAFGAIIAPGAQRSGPGALAPPSSAVAEVRELFSALAKNHMRQVRDFMIGVRWGEAPREWAAICEPAVLSLVRAAREMEMHALGAALTSFAAELSRAAAQPEGMLGEGARDALALAYAHLSEHMPDVFALEGERDRREAIIVHALLEQVPDVRKLTIDRMYAAGLTSLETLFLAKPDEIAATTGIGETLAALIVAKFAAYKQEASKLVDPSRSAECARLAELARELRAVDGRFRALLDSWDDDAHAAKKRLRAARTELMLQAKVLLARLGEVDRIAALERLPYARKIDDIEAFVRETQAQAQVKSGPATLVF